MEYQELHKVNLYFARYRMIFFCFLLVCSLSCRLVNRIVPAREGISNSSGQLFSSHPDSTASSQVTNAGVSAATQTFAWAPPIKPLSSSQPSPTFPGLQPPPLTATLTQSNPPSATSTLAYVSPTGISSNQGTLTSSPGAGNLATRAVSTTINNSTPVTPSATATSTLTPTTTPTPTQTATGTLPPGNSSGEILFLSSTSTSSTPSLWITLSDGSRTFNLRQPPVEAISLAWSPDGSRIAFVSPLDRKIYILEAQNSTAPVRLTSGTNGENTPVWSPNGDRVAFVETISGGSEIQVAAVDGTGPVVNVTANPLAGAFPSAPAWSPDGSQLVFRTVKTNIFYLYKVDSGGSAAPTQILRSPEQINSPAWSPDGNLIAFHASDQAVVSIFTVAPDGSNPRRVTQGQTIDSSPLWSPDSTRILFTSQVGSNFDIYTINPDGTGLLDLSNHSALDLRPAWSPDGRVVVFVSNRDGNLEIYRVNADGSQLLRLTNSLDIDDYPAWRP